MELRSELVSLVRTFNNFFHEDYTGNKETIDELMELIESREKAAYAKGVEDMKKEVLTMKILRPSWMVGQAKEELLVSIHNVDKIDESAGRLKE